MRKIIHIDMDCFYAAVEMRDNPDYRNIPLAVGGDGPRSVLSTCNYMARKFGVRSAMPAIRAKQLCPELVIVNGRMDAYKAASDHIKRIFKRYTDEIEPLSLDEAFLDVTDSPLHQGSATLIAQEIRQSIFDELKLTASAGVAPNKFLAKIASDENKPNGQCVLAPDKVAAFVEQLPLKKIPGIGPKTAEKLERHGFTTCEHVRTSSVAQLSAIVGSFAERLYQYSYGKDERTVKVNRIRKSVGVERTFKQDILNVESCLEPLDWLIDTLNKRLVSHKDRVIIKIGVKVKFNDFTQTTMEQQSAVVDEKLVEHLIRQAYERGDNKPVRLLGVFIGFASSTSKSDSDTKQQLTLAL